MFLKDLPILFSDESFSLKLLIVSFLMYRAYNFKVLSVIPDNSDACCLINLAKNLSI
jgi:hypothetical protein